jgi:transposase
MLIPELRLLAVPHPPRHGDLVITIGIDPHKRTHTAVAIDADRHKIGELEVVASTQMTPTLLDWAAVWPGARR